MDLRDGGAGPALALAVASRPELRQQNFSVSPNCDTMDQQTSKRSFHQWLGPGFLRGAQAASQ